MKSGSISMSPTMGIEIQSWAWRQKLNPATKLVFVKLAESANDETGECWPSLRHLGDRCDMAPSTVRFHLRKLKEAGLISVKSEYRADGTQTSNTYRILTPTHQEVDTYPTMDGRGTLQPIAPLEPVLEPEELKPTVLTNTYGEFGHVKLTIDEHGKLLAKLNGSLEHYINRFDRWAEEEPRKTKNRKPYLTILNWFERYGPANGENGNGQQRESAAQARQRRIDESDARVARMSEKPGGGLPS